MKKLTLILVIIIANTSLFAAKRTVSNIFASPAQYTTVQAAVDASATGDTIYVQPSVYMYGSVIMNKKLTILGAGYDGRSYQRNEIAVIADIALSFNGVLTSSSYSSIIGLYVGSISSAFDSCHHITIARCKVAGISIHDGGGTYTTSWSIYNNIIMGNLNCALHAGNIISNNQFTNSTNCISTSAAIAGTNMVNNNNFSGYFSNGVPILNTRNVQYYNNIFNNLNVAGQNVTILSTGAAYINNTFTKNLTYFISDPLPPAYNNSLGSGNFNNQNPLFTNAPTYGMPFNTDSVVSYNYRLLPASPGKNTGTDATDIGIYGGTTYAFKNDQGISALPQVTQLIILNPAVPLNNNLNVNSKGIKRN